MSKSSTNPLLSWCTPKGLQLPDYVQIFDWQEPLRDGVVAMCYDDGQLMLLRIYLNGQYGHSWSLKLKQGVEKGEARLVAGSGGSPDLDIYDDGSSDRVDAWSDNSQPVIEPYEKWVRRWVETISETGRRTMAMRDKPKK